MKESEITALAREYADMLKHLFPDMPEHTYRDKMSQAKNVVNIIMRRYCLVEKSKIKEVWSMITDVYLDHGHITYDEARYLFNEVLFPEIAKEVEG
jgi:hypothetical protein